MNKLHRFLVKHEKRLKYLLIAIGILFIAIGISIDWLKAWVIAIGDSYAKDGHCCPCRIYGDLILSRPPFIIIGSFLSLTLLFERQIIKLYEKYAIKLKLLLPIFIILIFITLALISYFPFHNYPYCLDEYSYLYQAKIFAQGKLYIETPEIFRPFKETYMVLKDNKLFSKYPPGFILFLSIGVLLNIPGLINPFIATITLIILYLLVRSFLGSRYGLLSVVLMSTTPYFLGYSASYFSQPTALLLTTLIFFMLREYELTSNSKYLLLLGFVSGYSVLTRPLDSFCVLVPTYSYLLYILYSKKELKKVSYPVLTFFPVFTFFLIYNYILVKNISIATYPIVTNEFRVVDPHAEGLMQNFISISLSYIQNGAEYVPKLLYRYFLIHAAFFVPLFAVFGMIKFKSKWKWILLLNFLMLIIFYNFHYGPGWPQYGARYYYSGFTSLVILATVAFKHLIEQFEIKNLALYLLTFILCVHLVFSFTAIREYSHRFTAKLAIMDEIKNECSTNSIVILDTKVNNPRKPGCYRKVSRMDFGSEKRNLFMNTSRLITLNDHHLDLRQIQSSFPNHSICFYKYGVVNSLLSYGEMSQ